MLCCANNPLCAWNGQARARASPAPCAAVLRHQARCALEATRRAAGRRLLRSRCRRHAQAVVLRRASEKLPRRGGAPCARVSQTGKQTRARAPYPGRRARLRLLGRCAQWVAPALCSSVGAHAAPLVRRVTRMRACMRAGDRDDMPGALRRAGLPVGEPLRAHHRLCARWDDRGGRQSRAHAKGPPCPMSRSSMGLPWPAGHRRLACSWSWLLAAAPHSSEHLPGLVNAGMATAAPLIPTAPDTGAPQCVD